jgi:hypothetical protein
MRRIPRSLLLLALLSVAAEIGAAAAVLWRPR